MEGFIFSEDLCRLCLWRSNKLLPIFSEEGEIQGIPMKIGMCLPISVTREDFLPKLICSQCIYKLEMFSEFRNSCVRSEQLLKRYTSHEPVQVPTCHAVIVQMPEEVKVEVHEQDPIAVEQDISFLCLIPDPVQKESPEDSRPLPVIECVSSMSTEATKYDDPKQDIISTEANKEKPRKSVKRIPAEKRKSNKTKPAASQRKYNNSHYTPRKVPCVPVVNSSRRNTHKCKHCSKHFSSRANLSLHLQSSNCLFQYTCRYCAKILGSVEYRIRHERSHRDKKSFICRVCKSKFQSSFDLNVHTVHGCEKVPYVQQQSTVGSEEKRPKTPVESNGEVNGEEKQSANTVKSKPVHVIKCKYCQKEIRSVITFKRHVNTCQRSFRMRQFHQMVKKRKGKKANFVEPQQAKANEKPKTKHNIRVRGSTRKKQDPPDSTPTVQNSSEISPKASLLAVLGLKEKSQPKPDELKAGKANSDVGVEDEVVTVCDICRKIFTSESGMLNHQITVHNRNMTAEKINSLMRVEV